MNATIYNRQRIYIRLPGGSPRIKMVIYTADLQDSQPNWLYTRQPDVNIKLLFTPPPFKSQIGCYTLLPGVYIKLLFTRQPFKSQIGYGRGYIHGCRVGVHVSKWLFTLLPFKILSQIGYMHGSRVSTAVAEPIQICTQLPGV